MRKKNKLLAIFAKTLYRKCLTGSQIWFRIRCKNCNYDEDVHYWFLLLLKVLETSGFLVSIGNIERDHCPQMVDNLHLCLKCHSSTVFFNFYSKNQLPAFFIRSGTLVENKLTLQALFSSLFSIICLSYSCILSYFTESFQNTGTDFSY